VSTVPKPTDPRPEPLPRVEEPAPAPPGAAVEPKSRKRRTVMLGILAVIVLAGLLFGIKTVLFYSHHAETDDAQVEGHIAPAIPKVSGYVTAVLVDDNQRIQAGQVVVRIDDRDLKSKVDTAAAAVDKARAASAVARANVAAVRTTLGKTKADLARYSALRQKEEVTAQQYDAAKAAADAAAAQVDASVRQVAEADAEIAQKQADLDYARLQLSYTTVTAPATGVVSRKSVEVGQNVQIGQPLLAVVADEQPWVVANFKETQLKKMRVGQNAVLEIDAYPKVEFHGRVDSFSAATGAKFALLPPDNATGNFTKVVQRVPVKIVFTDQPDPNRPLRAGMSVNAIVNVD